jgi:hypothetical protein
MEKLKRAGTNEDMNHGSEEIIKGIFSYFFLIFQQIFFFFTFKISRENSI